MTMFNKLLRRITTPCFVLSFSLLIFHIPPLTYGADTDSANGCKILLEEASKYTTEKDNSALNIHGLVEAKGIVQIGDVICLVPYAVNTTDVDGEITYRAVGVTEEVAAIQQALLSGEDPSAVAAAPAVGAVSE